MENTSSESSKKPAAAPKKPSKLPSKSISFSSQPNAKNGKQGGKVNLNKSKKGGVNLMKKLSGM
jgi:hypothetical protein